MITRRTFLKTTFGTAAVAATAAACGSSGKRAATTSGGAHIEAATAVTEVFGDGQKVTAVALSYDKPIDTSTLTTKTFTVADRTVTRVYANISPAPAEQGSNGSYVIVELSPDDASAALTQNAAGGVGGGTPPSGTAGAGAPPSGAMPSGSAVPSGGPGGFGGTTQAAKKAAATVVQVGSVTASDGTIYPATTAKITTSKVTNLIVDDFQQLEWKDPKTGQTIKYNLFTPRGYDKSKSYPLVLFMHDSSVLSTVTTTTLTQGLGAVCWASPADQATRPAFVLAPQYDTVVVDDHSGYTVTTMLETTVDLVNHLTTQFSIDRKRLYATGQSMGAIMSIVMDIRYPTLFAASYIVAGQWDPTTVTPLAKDKLFIVVSQGDTSAYPGENAITAVFEKAGATVSRATWDGTSSVATLDSDARSLIAEGNPINYASFTSGTVVPSTQSDTALNNHLNTWRVAYTIDAIRAWVFQQQAA